MKMLPSEIAKSIQNNSELVDKIKKADNQISKMILITCAIIDIDSYYIDFDKDLHPNLWENVLNHLN